MRILLFVNAFKKFCDVNISFICDNTFCIIIKFFFCGFNVTFNM